MVLHPYGGKVRRGEGGRVDVGWAFMVARVPFVPLKDVDPKHRTALGRPYFPLRLIEPEARKPSRPSLGVSH